MAAAKNHVVGEYLFTYKNSSNNMINIYRFNGKRQTCFICGKNTTTHTTVFIVVVANDLPFVLTSVSLIFCIELFLNFIVRKETKNV